MSWTQYIQEEETPLQSLVILGDFVNVKKKKKNVRRIGKKKEEKKSCWDSKMWIKL